MPMIFPPYLQKGDAIALVAPARIVTEDEMRPFKNLCVHFGFTCVEAPYLYAEHHQFAGGDTQRAEQINWAITDVNIKAIWCARGGYGITRILDSIDWRLFTDKPKWLIGFSDATLLLNQLYNLGIASIHGPMAIQAHQNVPIEDWEATFKLISGSKSLAKVDPYFLNQSGTASGYLVGGNLSLLAHATGTSWLPKPEQTILFLEDLDEYLYHVDRMLWQLEHSGFLSKIAGAVVGQFSEMRDNAVPFGSDAYHILSDHFKKFDYPVIYNFPSGHGQRNFPLLFGSQMSMKVNEERVILEYC